MNPLRSTPEDAKARAGVPPMYHDAFRVLDAAEAEHQPVARYALFSGGHDSLCSSSVAFDWSRSRGVGMGAAHINTGIGIPQTREYVRRVCESFRWPLTELHPDAKTYRELVLEHGFPGGPQSHNRHYYWLKQRQIRRLVREAKADRNDRVMLVTGIRLAESRRRMGADIATPIRRQGAQVWVSPILAYGDAHKDEQITNAGLPRNEVVDFLHRSGECLCGAFTQRGEFNEIDLFFPEVAAEIRALEEEAKAAGVEDCYWGRRGARENPDQLNFLPMCQSCEAHS